MKPRLLLTVGALFYLAGNAAGAIVVFKNGFSNAFTGTYSGTDDLMMMTNGGGYFFSSTDNFGARGDMAVGNTGASAEHIRRDLVRFDVSSLAGQYTSINSATLRLYVTGYALPVGGGTVNVFRMADANAGWVEGSGTSATGYGPEDAGGSTWAYKVQAAYPSEFAGTPWAGGGTTGSPAGAAGVAGTDYFSTPISSFTYTPSTAGFVDFVFSDPTLINTWVTGINAGLLLRQLSEAAVPGGNLINFHSSESTTGVGPGLTTARPELIIDFTAVPEPGRALLSMLGLGALFLGRRRST
jgi:hypothetical protein